MKCIPGKVEPSAVQSKHLQGNVYGRGSWGEAEGQWVIESKGQREATEGMQCKRVAFSSWRRQSMEDGPLRHSMEEGPLRHSMEEGPLRQSMEEDGPLRDSMEEEGPLGHSMEEGPLRHSMEEERPLGHSME